MIFYRIFIQYSEGTSVVVHNTFNKMSELIEKYGKSEKVKKIEVGLSSSFNSHTEGSLVSGCINNGKTHKHEKWPGYVFH